MNLSPLVFGNVYSAAPWGGRWIAALFGRTDAPEVCSESWELSGHPFGMSVVSKGVYAGRTLASLTEEFGSDLIGTKAPDKARFPLLVKLLDARRSLSVQVHPNLENAAATGGEAKTEAWYILAAAPGASLYAGTVAGAAAADFRAAAEQGETVIGMLKRHPAKAGDVLYIPGGVVHAIGAGCLVFEVQQSSNTTYRLYDWDRVDEKGVGRKLHIDESLKSIDYTFPEVKIQRANLELVEGANRWLTLVASPFFKLRELNLADSVKVAMDGSTFLSVFVLDGALKVSTPAGACHVLRGGGALVPAAAGGCELEADIAGTRLLVTTL